MEIWGWMGEEIGDVIGGPGHGNRYWRLDTCS